LATFFDHAGSSSGLYVNQVMFKTAYIFGIPLMFKKDIYNVLDTNHYIYPL